MTPPADEDDTMWRDLVRELHVYGISEAEAGQHRGMILKWAARAAAAGILEEQQHSMNSMMAKSQLESNDFEVLSAVYGTWNVTDTVARIFRAHRRLGLSDVSFIVTNETFGGDPRFNSVKSFSMVWRKVIYLDYGTLYTTPQKNLAEEGDTVNLDSTALLPYHESFDNDPGSVHIVCASWHNMDVTERVADIARSHRQPYVVASTHEFGRDPCFGTVKTMSVTWAYSDTPIALSHCEVKTVTENETLEIPPFLDIICANWGGLDVTNTIRAKIGQQQTLQLDTDKIQSMASPDPWPMKRKAISILYQYGSDPLQLLVVGERTGVISIHPKAPMHRSHFFSMRNGPSANITVIAAAWGLSPVLEAPFIQAALQKKEIPCTNAFFGRDGWGGYHKTCQVFLQNNLTSEVICVAGRENTMLALPTVWPGEEDEG